MKLARFALVLLVCSLGCEEKITVDYDPCKFAPANSKFPTLPFAYCHECFFTLQFMGQEYAFTGSQFEIVPSSVVWDPPTKVNLVLLTKNVFFMLHFVSPPTAEHLINSRGIKTPLLKLNTIGSLDSNVPPPVSASIAIYNYCKEIIEPVTDDVSQSYHQITDTELIESYVALFGRDSSDAHPYQLSYFYCMGVLKATFIINGETQVLTAHYKLRKETREKL